MVHSFCETVFELSLFNNKKIRFVRSQMMNMVEFSGRGEDYFRDEARRRDAEKKRRKARGESRERLAGGGGEKASRVRRKRSRQQSEARRMWRERKEGGPGGGINESIDLSVQRSSAVLSLSSLIYSDHQHGMDFLRVASLHLSVIGMNGGITEVEKRGGTDMCHSLDHTFRTSFIRPK